MTQTHRQALPKGYMLQEYQVHRVLGAGGFGLTYLGWDTQLDKPVAIKEYLPNDLAVRESDHSVLPKSDDDEGNFRWGLERFLDEARTLARFRHPNIIGVHRYFEAHNTAYIVMEYAEGETLDELLKREGALEESRLLSIMNPLLDGLEEVHRGDFLHRDIKPGNILIRTDGSPVLVDFGAARQAIGSRSRSITSVVTPGYAPIEQYSSRGNQGPWTDIYALGAVMYKAVCGEAPPDATERVRDDPLNPASEACSGAYPAALLKAIDWSLSVDEGSRPQDIGSWRAALLGGEIAPADAAAGGQQPEKKTPGGGGDDRKARSGGKRTNAMAALVAGAAVILLVGLVYVYVHYQRQGLLSACESSYQEGDHESVVAACSELSEEGVADAVNVLNRSRQRETEREATKKEAERLAREAVEKEEAERLARKEAARKEAERLAREAAEKEKAERLKAGRVFRDCDVCPEMVVVPPGSFTMGSPPSEKGRFDNEGPVHRVNIAYSFAVGVLEVTRGEYSHFVSAAGHSYKDSCWTFEGGEVKERSGRDWRRPGFSQTGRDPVVCVSWGDAQGYVRWLSGKTGKRYRLLSESEWEYAARAGTTTAYHFGGSISSSQANFGVNENKTVSAGSYPPNAFGLHDVHGNVWEWTQDCWNENYQDAPGNGSGWESGDCSRRVLRGGSWDVDPRYLRSANRVRNTVGLRNLNSGFRVARTLTP